MNFLLKGLTGLQLLDDRYNSGAKREIAPEVDVVLAAHDHQDIASSSLKATKIDDIAHRCHPQRS